MQITPLQNNKTNYSFCGYVDKSFIRQVDNVMKSEMATYIADSKKNNKKVATGALQIYKRIKNNLVKIIKENMNNAHPQTVLTCIPDKNKSKGMKYVLKNPIINSELEIPYKFDSLNDLKLFTRDLNQTILHKFEISSLNSFSERFSEFQSKLKPKNKYNYISQKVLQAIDDYAGEISEK